MIWSDAGKNPPQLPSNKAAVNVAEMAPNNLTALIVDRALYSDSDLG